MIFYMPGFYDKMQEVMNNPMPLSKFEKGIGYSFKDIKLLETALTHPSATGETGRISNQRLEFLGDAVLQLAVSDILYSAFGQSAEGTLSKVRAEIVCADSLYSTGRRIHLDDYLILGKGEERSGGRDKKNIIADAVEALIAAIYLDGGRDKSDEFIRKNHAHIIDEAMKGHLMYDYKTMLQEYAQSEGYEDLSYELISVTGPDHDQTFTSRAVMGGISYEPASSYSKKQSEHRAAENVLRKLGKI